MVLRTSLDLPRVFGPYTLTRRLAVGGMAEVYAAKTRGIGGFEKLVAIKVIHPRYSEDEHFVQMLVEEAKISVLLTHANVAQIFDLGCIEDTYFIVMEYIEGVDGSRIIRRSEERGVPIPLEVAAYIVAEMCNGLDYAHRKRDAEGRPLHIVHRDVSPQNVLVSNSGEVKLVDFGIAKAAMRAAQTEAGVIKGKYYYMSPEQAWGDPLDHRSDIFSTGIVLHELLTGEMVYAQDNLPLLLDAVRKAEIQPPLTKRPDVPADLSAIAMRAIVRGIDARYGSANEMAQELMSWVYRAAPTFGAARLAQWMGELFGDELRSLGSAEQNTEMGAEDDEASRPVKVRTRDELSSAKSVLFGGAAGPEPPGAESVLDDQPTLARWEDAETTLVDSSQKRPSHPDEDDSEEPTHASVESLGPISVATPPLLEALAGPSSEETAPVLIEEPPSTPPPPSPAAKAIFEQLRETRDSAAPVSVDRASPSGEVGDRGSEGVPVRAEPNAPALSASIWRVSVGRRTALGLGAALCALLGAATVWFLARATSEPEAVRLEVISVPAGAELRIDGQPVARTPVRRETGLEIGKEYALEVVLEGYQPWRDRVRMTHGAVTEVAVLTPLRATLRVETDPAGAQVWLDGSYRGSAPLDIPGLSVGQDIRVEVRLDGFLDASERVRVTAADLQPRVRLGLMARPAEPSP